jgi:hypothetical protein
MKLATGLFGWGAYLCSILASVPATAQAAPATTTTSALDAEAAAFVRMTAPFLQANTAIYQALLKEPPPSLQDPIYAGQVATAFDLSWVETMKDRPHFAGVCHGADGTQAAYLLRGINMNKEGDPFAILPRLKFDASEAALKLKRENYLRFQDELIMALRFGLVCRTVQLEKLDAHLQEMPSVELFVFRTGFPDFQQGLAELVTYHVSALRDPIRPENRRAVINLLAQYIDRLAAGMAWESRQTASAAVAKALATKTVSPDERAKLKKLEVALKRTDCGRVCAFH